MGFTLDLWTGEALLARCADGRGDAADRRQRLAGLFCAAAGRRLASLWPDLEGSAGAGATEGYDDHRAGVDWWTATPAPSPEFDQPEFD